MKMNIEEIIKKSVEGHEMPYDAAAWDQMSKRLDQVMPTKPASNLKWYLGGAAVIAAVSISAILLSNNSEEQKVTPSVSQTTETNSNDSKNQPNHSVDNNTGTDVKGVQNNEFVQIDLNDVTAQNSGSSNQNTSSTSQNSGSTNTTTQNGSNSNANNTADNQRNNSSTTQQASNSPSQISIPKIENICLGESVKIQNKNEAPITLIQANGLITTIKPKSSLTFIGDEAGTYKIGVMKGADFIEGDSFKVLEGPNAEFSIVEANTFDNGVPVVRVESGSTGSNYNWSINGIIREGKNAEFNLFEKGNYNIVHEVTGSNGCKSSVARKVTIEEDYNLLAANAIRPNSSIGENTSFMPFALTVRDVEFTLIIVDAANGAVIFESSDATQGWDGTDKRNGQQVKRYTPFAWKVVIKNPLPGERNEYRGTVTVTD
ncbi:MAG: hypothetical protein EP305_02540 [Bacteroidetes bacterium]|nr:MAG: hypothetical protein EP305_02540 [Bacteroidota bacterium]